MRPRGAWELAKQTLTEWGEDKVPRLGAALAFYSALSLAPLLVIALGIVQLVYQGDAVGQIETQFEGLIGPQAAHFVGEVASRTDRPGGGWLATLVGLSLLMLGASGVFAQLQDALNTIWEVRPKPGRGVVAVIRSRFLSFTMVLGTGFLLLVSLLLSAALAVAGAFFEHRVPLGATVWQGIHSLIGFGVVTGLFALIFRVVPDADIAWRDTWIGALFTAFLFSLGKFGIGFYLGRSALTSAYGTAGMLVVLLIWVYYSAQILFLGAEFTQVYANRFGSRVVPAAGAVAVTEESRRQEGLSR
jgi:membrane protein